MKLTDIKQQIKRADRYSIYVDERYAFSLSVNGLLGQELYIGQEIDESGLAKLKKISEDDKAYQRVLDLLSRRARSTWEVEQYLKIKSYNDNTIKNILNKLSKSNYLNDTEFAKWWVDSRRSTKATSRRKLAQELALKRVDSKIIDKVLQDDPTNDLTEINKIITKKLKQTKYQDKLKLMQYLTRQGFNYDDIKVALEEISGNSAQ